MSDVESGDSSDETFSEFEEDKVGDELSCKHWLKNIKIGKYVKSMEPATNIEEKAVTEGNDSQYWTQYNTQSWEYIWYIYR